MSEPPQSQLCQLTVPGLGEHGAAGHSPDGGSVVSEAGCRAAGAGRGDASRAGGEVPLSLGGARARANSD